MTPIRIPSQVFCPHCQAANLPRSPYCSGCGAPLGDLALAEVPRNRFSSGGLISSPVVRLETLLTDGQDAAAARLAYDSALAILTEGEELRYIATGSKSILGPTPECVVATSKRMMIFRKKRLGKSEMDDIFWRDVTRAEMKDSRGAVSLCLDSVQGWRLTTEPLPAAQARKLYEVIVANTPRLQQLAAQAAQVSLSPAPQVQATAPQAASTPVLVSQPAAVPDFQAQPLQVQEQPGTAASVGMTVQPTAAQPPATVPVTTASDPQPEVTGAQAPPMPASVVASSQEAVPEQAQPAENELPSKPLIPTPESVLQEILRSLPARNPSSRPLTGPAAHNSEPLVHAPLVPAQVPEPAVSVQATQQPVSQASTVRVPQPAVQPAVNMAAAPAPAVERQVIRESGPLAGAAGISPRKGESGPLPPTRQGASGPLAFPAKPSTGPVPGTTQGVQAQPHTRLAPTGPLYTQVLQPDISLYMDAPPSAPGSSVISDTTQPVLNSGLLESPGKQEASRSSRQKGKAAAQDDPLTKLKLLKEMLDMGLITPDDYEVKKGEILGRI